MPSRSRAPPARRGGETDVGVDVIGDIAILKSRASRPAKERAAKHVLASMKNVKAVFEQEGGIEGELRLRKLRHLAGEARTVTTHRENGCSFRVDVASCYFSPRLSTERLRVAEEVGRGETVLNMFAGVGPFSIEIAKKSGARVTSCELNPAACAFHRENNELNRVSKLVEVIESDARELAGLGSRYDRVLMPHPSATDRFLDVAARVLKPRGKIHYYRHALGRDAGEGTQTVAAELSALLGEGWKWSIRKVREVGPRWLEMVAEIRRAP